MVIAVDFDGTIVEHEYPKIGRPLPFAFEVLRKLQQEENHTLILWTMREGKLLQEAIDYCEKNGVRFFAHNKNYPEEKLQEGDPRKLSVDLFIDDRNIGGLPDWGIIYQLIKYRRSSPRNLDMMDSDKGREKRKNLFIRLGEAWEKARGYRY
ncbi:hypothetical protein AGMMS50262_06660 [Bacteroidia bacterium]|nr:hypothetical protein AGMMS50262_06660 [Bacteroidia bacterium]